MAKTYRGPGPWGAGKGAKLTILEGDTNIYELATDVADLVANPPTAVSIVDIEVTGNGLITFIMSDASEIGPVQLPIAEINFRGDWAPSTSYDVGDFVTYANAIYPVTYAHVSSGSFDPGANSGPGNDWYGTPLEVPASAIPTGGTDGQVLTKQSGTDFDMDWEDLPSKTNVISRLITVEQALANTTQYVLVPFDCDVLSASVVVHRDSFSGTVTVVGTGIVVDLLDSPAIAVGDVYSDDVLILPPGALAGDVLSISLSLDTSDPEFHRDASPGTIAMEVSIYLRNT